MTAFESLVRVTDNIAREPIRARGLLAFPVSPWIIVAVHKGPVSIAVAATLSLTALVFVGWRFWVVTRQQVTESDELYDTRTKFELSSEYHETESATAAAKRRRES